MDSPYFKLKRLDNEEFINEFALLGLLVGNDFGQQTYTFLTGAKVLNEVYQRLNEKENLLAYLRADAVRKIATYCQMNPKASSDAQAKEIKKHLDDFCVKVALVTGKIKMKDLE
ncbi:uncharacterized protein LOC100209795 isoform X1 [Hydra vulgaris]|uniref:uncharacterized protein LOC100209795 isoform X1 n=1 Tax=Hydra vulgaris TaxID=6087 RepID=UPI0002B459C8|nr:uncharacterized protein LOC100209795 isoform X1 [Hydra vulgaris]